MRAKIKIRPKKENHVDAAYFFASREEWEEGGPIGNRQDIHIYTGGYKYEEGAGAH